MSSRTDCNYGYGITITKDAIIDDKKIASWIREKLSKGYKTLSDVNVGCLDGKPKSVDEVLTTVENGECSIVEAFSGYEGVCYYENGLFAYITDVINAETGVSLEYDEDYEFDEHCSIYMPEMMPWLYSKKQLEICESAQSLKHFFNKYVEELGLLEMRNGKAEPIHPGWVRTEHFG